MNINAPLSPADRQPHQIRDAFQRLSTTAADLTGSSAAFLLATSIVMVWLLIGPHFGYSDTWQLIINTLSSVVALLMVFIIQNSQTRDTLEIHLKLDELIRALGAARNQFLDLEDLSEDQLEQIRESFQRQAQRRTVPGKPTDD